jgi:MFS family permease
VLIFPAVAFAALQYAAGVVWLTVLSNVLSLTFPLPPYSFSPEQIGFTSAGPLIGNVLGAIYGGVLGDKSILYYSRKNKGYYEPEMRLYILHLPALVMAGGLIMFGVTISRVSLYTPIRRPLSIVFSIVANIFNLNHRACTGSIPTWPVASSDLDSVVSVTRHSSS